MCCDELLLFSLSACIEIKNCFSSYIFLTSKPLIRIHFHAEYIIHLLDLLDTTLYWKYILIPFLFLTITFFKSLSLCLAFPSELFFSSWQLLILWQFMQTPQSNIDLHAWSEVIGQTSCKLVRGHLCSVFSFPFLSEHSTSNPSPLLTAQNLSFHLSAELMFVLSVTEATCFCHF